MVEIVKVQRPVMPPSGPWLVYDQRRKNMQQFEPDIGTKNKMGDDYKGYFRANFTHGKWHIGDRVKDQSW